MQPKLQPGDTAPDFSLPAATGGTVRLTDERDKGGAVVVMFICNHCPYVKAYIPRLIALQNELKAARFVAICSNDAGTYPEDSFENMTQQAAAWGLNFAYLRDEDQAVAKAYGAERTPEIFVLDPGGVCRYEGGIDDNYQKPDRVTRRPLRDAVTSVLAGKAVAEPTTHAIGCTIKWKK